MLKVNTFYHDAAEKGGPEAPLTEEKQGSSVNLDCKRTAGEGCAQDTRPHHPLVFVYTFPATYLPSGEETHYEVHVNNENTHKDDKSTQ